MAIIQTARIITTNINGVHHHNIGIEQNVKFDMYQLLHVAYMVIMFI